jgi:hypothetical protein
MVKVVPSLLLALHIDRPIILGHDAVNDVQAQPSPLPGVFGCEEGINNLAEIFLWDSYAVIVHLHLDESAIN